MVSTGLPSQAAAEGAAEVDRTRLDQGLPLGAYALGGAMGFLAFEGFDQMFVDIDSAVVEGGFEGVDGGGDQFWRVEKQVKHPLLLFSVEY